MLTFNVHGDRKGCWRVFGEACDGEIRNEMFVIRHLFPPCSCRKHIPSSGAELSAELSPSELPDAVVLLTFFFVALFFSDPFPGLTFFLPLVPPTVH